MGKRKKTGFWEKLDAIDNRVFYVILTLSMVIPLLFPFNIPIPVTQYTRDFYEQIEALPTGSTVLWVFDYTPAWSIACEFAADAIKEHCMKKGINIIAVTSMADAIPATLPQINRWLKLDNRIVYGENFVYIGFIPGEEMGISALASDLKFSIEDFNGDPLEEMHIYEGVETANDIDLVIGQITSEVTSTAWIRQWSIGPGIPLIMSVGSTRFVSLLAYYPTSIKGLLNDLIGSTEYEYLVKVPGFAMGRMVAQTMALIISLSIVLSGNLVHLMLRINGKKGEEVAI